MTQAFNLSQLANKVNTSGQLDVATGVTGTQAVANGGTGQSSYTNGQLLIGNTTGNTLTKATLTAGSGVTITNGTGSITIAASGGVSSLNGQTGAITNTDLYAIGSYITGRPGNGTNYAVNSTIAGSSLYSVTPVARHSSGATFASYSPNTATFSGDLINTGTWRVMSGAIAPQGGYTGLWVRIS